jgi:nitrite reductase/ring-hydroxylating ferredoxin subunit
MDVNRLYDLVNANNERYSLGEFKTHQDIDARRHGRGVKYEGEDGKFSQTWFPICKSSEVPAGEVIGRSFLDGEVVVFRGENGVASVMSAYCPHNGAHLKTGEVIGDELRCAFHHWCFNAAGKCTKTGAGDPVPPRGNTFAYPTQERFGLIWAFNGTEATWDIPDLVYPDDELVFHPSVDTLDLISDPWCFMCNTLDFNHLRCVHGIYFDQEDPIDHIKWTDHSVVYPLKGKFKETDEPIQYDLGIFGTNIFWQTGYIKGRWFGFLFPVGMHRPGTSRSYFVMASRKVDGDAEDPATKEFLDFVLDLEKVVVSQDMEILNSIRYTRGHFTKSDRALAKFIDHLNAFPRAHPGAEYIR